jgi:hypothetical protein
MQIKCHQISLHDSPYKRLIFNFTIVEKGKLRGGLAMGFSKHRAESYQKKQFSVRDLLGKPMYKIYQQHLKWT